MCHELHSKAKLMKSIFKLVLLSPIVIYLGCNSIPVSEIVTEEKEIVEEIKLADKLLEIETPYGFERLKTNDYGNWMRNLNLKKDNIVYYYNGEEKPDQSIHVAVLDFDIGDKDLQQCADACMRIRAEYLFEQKKVNEITFLLASGKWKPFVKYTTKKDYPSFRKYMNYIFSYANTASLKKQLNSVSNFNDIQIGDVLVQSGNPYGHAVTVMDVCENTKGEKQFLLSQSYMPAQNIEILINPNSTTNSPWYSTNFEGNLITPEWVFAKGDLKRF